MADEPTSVQGSSEQKSHDEWLEAERERLRKGYEYTPPPPSARTASGEGAADQALAGLGLGAAAAAGVLGPHPNPITFQGVRPSIITSALQSEISDDDTRVQERPSDGGLVAVISQSPASAPHRFTPALTVTFLESPESVTVTVSELRKSALRDKWSSIGGTVLEQTGQVLGSRRRRGVGGLLDMAGSLKDGVEDLVDDIQDLSLPRRVWAVIDRVGGAAEEAHLEEVRKARALEWQREAAIRAYTHCEWCGRAYAPDEGSIVECPSCGGARAGRPSSP